MKRMTAAVTSPIADLKLIPRPSRFTGTRDDWPEFKFRVENYFTCVDLRYDSELQTSAAEASEILRTGGEINERSTLFYAGVAALSQGKAQVIAKSLRASRCGYELCRKLHKEY